ncbi:MAG: hypothetical protein GY757_30370 [bacterium]|nr:hypothetical protein [bacterium]
MITMKKLCTLLLALLSLLSLSLLSIDAKEIKKVVLPELLKAERLALDNDRMFITENLSIYIYSMKDFKFIKKFGKEGEGPAEIRKTPNAAPIQVYTYPDSILVNSDFKISYFTRDGEFIKCLKTRPFGVFSRFKDRYAGIVAARKDKRLYLSIGLFDPRVKLIKYLFVSDIEIFSNDSETLFPGIPVSFAVSGDKLFVTSGKNDFLIDAYDVSGKKLYSIKKEYDKIKIPDSYKDEVKHFFKTDPSTRDFWPQIKRKLKFQEYYPAIQTIIVDDNKLYTITFNQRAGDGRTECIVTDLKGKELKRVFLMLPKGSPVEPPPLFAIEKNRYYSIVEDEEEEEWILHIEEL